MYLRLIKTSEGGRQAPIPRGTFQGMITFDGIHGHDFSAVFHKALQPGESLELDVSFLSPDLVAGKIGLRASFVLLDGQPIGHGHVLAYFIENAKAACSRIVHGSCAAPAPCHQRSAADSMDAPRKSGR
jgi:hypothetical protein